MAPEEAPAGAGRVVVLNGTSSSGKTSLALKLQARLAEAGQCWMVIGSDVMFPLLPQAFVTYGTAAIGEHGADGLTFRFVDGELERAAGPVGLQILDACRAWVGATARAGLNVLVDEVLFTKADWTDWRAALAGLDVHWVGIEIELEVVEQRERARGDRPTGLARSQHHLVHRYATYDTTVDTGALDLDAAADLVLAAIRR